MNKKAKTRTNELRIATLKRRIEQAQKRVRRYIRPDVSLVDDFLSERRAAVKH